ncbi:MAG: DUF4102 domain-containing protein [Synergistaceae bacterium]|nr:DUF4102 domain-containing protein [Synergistaceae bacterium]
MLDGGYGLYLGDSSVCKYWILRFRKNEREHQVSLGVCLGISLNEAGVKSDELQNRRKNGELISLSSCPDKSPVILFGVYHNPTIYVMLLIAQYF